MWRKNVMKATPADFYAELASVESHMELAFKECTKIRKCIAATAHYQGYELVFTQLDVILARDHPLDEESLSPLDKVAIRRGSMNTPFTLQCLEKERRWIFKKLQEFCPLTNVERMCTQMVGELQARPEFDVITIPFSSPTWNPLIQAYLKDRERMELLLLPTIL